jgi:hypothetical protein
LHLGFLFVVAAFIARLPYFHNFAPQPEFVARRV